MLHLLLTFLKKYNWSHNIVSRKAIVYTYMVTKASFKTTSFFVSQNVYSVYNALPFFLKKNTPIFKNIGTYFYKPIPLYIL